MESKTWWKAITYPTRMDYLSFQQNEICFVMAIEKLLGIEPTPKAVWMRTLLAELTRIHSHLVWLGTTGLELGAISMFWYCFRERDLILDLFEMVTGVRMHTRYVQTGGLAEDIPKGFYAECRKFVDVMPKRVDEYESLFSHNPIFVERTRGIGHLSAEDAVALGQTGPMLRASGVDWDLRKAQPYLAYDQVDFDVPVYYEGDVYARYKVHMDEMRESCRIVHQCLEGMPEGPWIVDDRALRAAAARGAAHLDGESDPPLQARHRGVSRPRRRGLRLRSSLAWRAGLLPRLGRRATALAGQVPDAVVQRPPGTATCLRHSLIADMIAIAASLDPVMGDVDR